jgi:hypothetical protein
MARRISATGGRVRIGAEGEVARDGDGFVLRADERRRLDLRSLALAAGDRRPPGRSGGGRSLVEGGALVPPLRGNASRAATARRSVRNSAAASTPRTRASTATFWRSASSRSRRSTSSRSPSTRARKA